MLATTSPSHLFSDDTSGLTTAVFWPSLSELDSQDWKSFEELLRHREIKGDKVSHSMQAVCYSSRCRPKCFVLYEWMPARKLLPMGDSESSKMLPGPEWNDMHCSDYWKRSKKSIGAFGPPGGTLRGTAHRGDPREINTFNGIYIRTTDRNADVTRGDNTNLTEMSFVFSFKAKVLHGFFKKYGGWLLNQSAYTCVTLGSKLWSPLKTAINKKGRLLELRRGSSGPKTPIVSSVQARGSAIDEYSFMS